VAVELVTVTITGANGTQSRAIPVNVNPSSGNGSALFTYTGTTSGADAVTAAATIGGSPVTSNVASVNWVQPNGLISISPITATFYTGGQNYTGTGALKGGPVTINSLVINQIENNFPMNGWTLSAHPSPWQFRPFQALQQDTYGNFTGVITLPGTGYNTDSNYQGSMVVAAAGTYTFYFRADDSWVFFMAGAQVVATGSSNGGTGTITGITSKLGLPLMSGRMNAGHTIQSTDYVVVSFAQPGIYAFEIGSGYSGANADGNVYLEVTYAAGNIPSNLNSTLGQDFGGMLLPASNFSTAPATSTVTTPLGITPSGGSTNLQILGSAITLTLQIAGATLIASPYLPLLEGHAGQVYISNAAIGTFNFPPLPGSTVIDYSAALILFDLNGSSNAANRGTLTIQSTGGGFKLAFNGGALDPSIPVTTVAVGYKEFAWYNPASKVFDTYTPTFSGGGGRSAVVPVYWLVQPAIGSVLPTSLPGDGGYHTITLTLTKPLPPSQAAATATFTGSGGISVTSSQPNVLSTGFVTGWTITVLTSVVGGTTAASITATVGDNLTYLSGDSIVTGAVTYINAVSTSISLTP